MTALGERLKMLRDAAGLTQKQLAEAIGVPHREQISQWERGEREPDMEYVHRIAEYFNVSVDYLIGRTDDPRPLPEAASPSPSRRWPRGSCWWLALAA